MNTESQSIIDSPVAGNLAQHSFRSSIRIGLLLATLAFAGCGKNGEMPPTPEDAGHTPQLSKEDQDELVRYQQSADRARRLADSLEQLNSGIEDAVQRIDHQEDPRPDAEKECK